MRASDRGPAESSAAASRGPECVARLSVLSVLSTSRSASATSQDKCAHCSQEDKRQAPTVAGNTSTWVGRAKEGARMARAATSEEGIRGNGLMPLMSLMREV